MIFAAPWILLAFAALPVIWWLIRITPPAPRSETFPAIRFLLGLNATEETPARTPPWLMALRMLAAGLIIFALARPVLDAGAALTGNGPFLLVIDNGWASASDWAQRKQAATALLDRAERAGRKAALLATAPDGSGSPLAVSAAMPVAELRARLTALQPESWPPDRAAAVQAIHNWHDREGASVGYIPDGLTDGSDFPAFAEALRDVGAVTEICCDTAPPPILLPPTPEADRLVVRLAQVPRPVPTHAVVLGESGDDRTLARTDVQIPAGAATASGSMALPPELRNRLTRLVMEGPPSAGSVVLLDERWRRRPVGLLAGDLATADTPFIGSLYFVRRALGPYNELRDGSVATLLKRDISVLILADRPLQAGPERDALTEWVRKGGLLIRFAGPRTAEAAGNDTDTLLPVRLLAGDRQLGGAMSWSQPAGLAPFPSDSPFAGLLPTDEVKVQRQVLAEPSADLTAHTWATLKDGTPLVTQTTLGAGRIVLFHVTANADWSDLPLSGLFVDMLRRLVSLSVGVTTPADTTVLAPTIAAARLEPFSGASKERALGPPLLGAATLILCLDMLISLALRGLLRRGIAAAGVALLLLASAPAAHALESNPNPAIATRLGYILSGDSQVDATAKSGLEGLSEYVNRRTAATLYEPDPIRPGETDLSLYPLLYWPITADTPDLTSAQAAALNDYMARGGIILIDTRGSGSGEGFAPGAAEALRRIARPLNVPPLAPLTSDHVLSRSFYLLPDFPGRFTGDTVWVQRDQDRTNDSVSPVVIGGNDWAAAWAMSPDGSYPYAVIPGGQRQRTLAYRFGVNLVMYALTGNYKGDQVHIPAILQRLGQ
jgi:hypothetical protein